MSVEYIKNHINISTVLGTLLTISALLLVRALYRFFLKPFLQVTAYKMIPNIMITYKISGRKVWSYSDVSAPPIKTNHESPFLSTESYNVLRQHPDLKVIVSNLGKTPQITLIDHNLCALVIKNHDNYMHPRMSSMMGKRYLRHSMIFSTGNEWKRQKRLISKAFTFESMQKLIPTIQDLANEFFAKDAFSNQNDPIFVHKTLISYTWEVISRSFFGDNVKNYTVQGQPFAQGLITFMKEQVEILWDKQYQIFGEHAALWNSHIRDQKKKVEEFGKTAEKIIQELAARIKRGETKASDERKGILELILESSEESNDRFTNIELIANFLMMSSAGTDTSSHTSSGVLFCLATFPEVKRKLTEEIEANWDGVSPITLTMLNKLEYLHALILETLRVMSPGPFLLPRIVKHDHMIGNVPVKKGYLLRAMFIPTWLSPNWITDPELFKPERWIKGHQEQQQLQDVYIFNPFSFGGRACLGQHLAMTQIKIALCYFLTRFDFELPPNFKLSPMIQRATMEPKDPIKLIIKPKSA